MRKNKILMRIVVGVYFIRSCLLEWKNAKDGQCMQHTKKTYCSVNRNELKVYRVVMHDNTNFGMPKASNVDQQR